ncbi:MAG: ABC transporter substrate-binding protein [Spirochaetes bacterium]|nr:ABC transporter substrate-binding protein [Spirochaetota bacterium]
MANKRFRITPLVRAAFGAVLILSTLLVFTGCGGQAAEHTDTIIVGGPSMPVNLDPILTNDIPSGRVMLHIYDTLVSLDHDMVPRPGLAESWEWVDPASPTQLRVFLRGGVFFHNGDELTASDVAFSINRAAAAPIVSAFAGMVQSASVVNDHEVLITLEHPFVPLISFLGLPALSIVNERAVTEMGNAHSQSPVGTGPFRVTNIITGYRIDLVRWEHYWGTPPQVENLAFLTLPDAGTRLMALETGEIDVMITVLAHTHSHIRAHPGLTLHHELNVGTHYIAFNVSRPPFDDIRVRHAMQYAIDLDAMVEAVFMGTMGPARGPLSSNVWGSAADRLEPFPFNPERARELLAEAGFPDGFSTTFFANQGNPAALDTAEIMQNMLREVGVDMSIHLLEWGAFLESSNRGEPDIITLSFITVAGDPDHGLFAPFHSSTWGAGNRAFFSNPEVDRLLEAGREETDLDARAEIYYQIQRIIRDESPWIFLAEGAEAVATRSNLQGFRLAPNLMHRFDGLHFTY